ncbi:MAG: hypothetical protein Q9P01_18715 [Anaerolineae bacterium]|nr:hypothetical protein [Anaerolineae bacterium]MDQ7036787.1 hypothetical protein [Anaerolineae bacterium]
MDGFQEEFSSNIAFEYLNATDGGAGEAAFVQLGVRGHPTIIIFDATGEEIYRTFGLVEEDAIEGILQDF